MFFWDTVY